MTEQTNKPSASLWVFFGLTVVWFLLLIALWMQVSQWVTYPAGKIAQIALDHWADFWINSINLKPGVLEAKAVWSTMAANQEGVRVISEVNASAKTDHFGYGFPLLLALLLASRSKKFFKRAILGYCILQFPQAWSIAFELLRNILMAPKAAAGLQVGHWEMQGVYLAFQIGSYLVPTLVPVGLWLWFERRFFAAVVLDGWLNHVVKRMPKDGSGTP
jgi:hypothetical protein